MKSQPIRFRVPAGLNIVGDVAGALDAQPVFLLHGGGQTRGSWKNTIESVANLGYRAYVLDARGHGESDHDPSGNYTPDAFAQDLLSIVAQVAQPPVLEPAIGGITPPANPGLQGPCVPSGMQPT